jgi:hypothetical protein
MKFKRKDVNAKGIVKAIPLEEYLWKLAGENKLNKIVTASGIYRDKVTNSTLAKYFTPVVALTSKEIGVYTYINDFVKANYETTDLRWDDDYKNEMYTDALR